ncbi:NAD(P)/FAD-dependent oxidoreductase [Spelaeicoccus albus]|uniref:D-amino-acid dehydrogenase n=1 Tax=Spelaeicoccus albus TaxID=1280376 RepID=A0A7Z0D1B9_9MICO|nr:FAD-dependent oxidoreductase [Spelaeicoccus albus]NYI66758.1 D-amino-acid dehydrogenase [Spelaeicoccus albus]
MSVEHVVVVGSGIAGAAAAFALARRGVGVSVIDSNSTGRATSAGAGIIQPWATNAAGPYYDLYALGAGYYPTLLDRLALVESTPVDFQRNGSLVVSADGGELDDVEKRVRGRAESAPLVGELSRLDNSAARELFPPLGGEYSALLIPGGARVDGRSLREGLLSAAGSLGARILGGTATLDADGRVHCDGVRVSADATVVAAGCWTNALLEPLGVRLPVAPQRGQIVHLGLAGVDTSPWPSVIPQTSHYLVAFDDSRVVVGATREADGGFDARVTAAGQQEVLANALAVAPGLAGATVLETRVGLRPLADSPQIGRLPGVPGLFVSTGFGAGGLTMGPVSGELIADLIMEDDPQMDVGAFAPEAQPTNGAAI